MPEQERHILYKLKPALAGDQITDAVDIEIDSTSVTGILANTPNAQNALERLDNTGLGAQPRTFTGTFFSSIANQDQWYGGRQSVIMVGARGQTNGNYAFRLPSLSDLTFMFDDLALRGLGEVYTLTIRYLGGNDASIVRNSLTIVAPSVSASFDRNEIPATIGQGASVSYTIERVAGVIGSWERLGTGQAADPVATIGEVVLQSLSWNNQDGAVLPAVGQVLQGYAFPVLGSNPNDGTLRQSLLDAGVSDRMIYDGDYVVWTAATFTAWTDGDNWFVINRNSLQRLTREESNFLSQVSEIDNRVNLGPVASLTGDALVWVSENPLVDAPFLSPSTDPSNPRLGDSYAYIGGRENRNGMLQFTFGQNRFNSFMTIGITPSFIAGHQLSDIFIYLRDSEGNIVQTLNLADDFTLRDDTGDWTNGRS
nr:hypothetical protein [Gammaproteobacteria bacterium]